MALTVRVPRVTYNRFTALRVRPSEVVIADLGRIADPDQITAEYLASMAALAEDTVPVMLTSSQINDGIMPIVDTVTQVVRPPLDIGKALGLLVAAANGDGRPRRTGKVTPKGSIPVAPDEHVPTGDDIRSMRLQRGWTQEHLAQQAGLFHRVVSEVETGVRQNEYTRSYLARILTSR